MNTETSGSSSTIVVSDMKFEYVPPRPVATRDLFDVEVFASDVLRLIPRTELAKSLLGMWLGMDSRQSATMLPDTYRKLVIGGTTSNSCAYGRGMQYMDFEFSSKPMLCSGDDPHFTGMRISQDEQEACRKLVDRMRAKAGREARRTRKATKGRKT